MTYGEIYDTFRKLPPAEQTVMLREITLPAELKQMAKDIVLYLRERRPWAPVGNMDELILRMALYIAAKRLR